MVPASLYLGFTASIIWVGQVVSCRLLSLILLYSEMEPTVSQCCQGTYLTSAAFSHAEDCHLHEGTVIGNFNGEFWGVFASHQVLIIYWFHHWKWVPSFLKCFKEYLFAYVSYHQKKFGSFFPAFILCFSEIQF